MVRSEATAEASFAAILERIRLGIAIAAMIRMIATTISNSINEKPFCLLRILSNLLRQLHAEAQYLVARNGPLRLVSLSFRGISFIMRQLQAVKASRQSVSARQTPAAMTVFVHAPLTFFVPLGKLRMLLNQESTEPFVSVLSTFRLSHWRV